MKGPMRSLSLGVLLGLAVGVVAACNSLIGAGAPNEVEGLGGATGSAASCTLASDCPNQQICLFQACSKQCAADKDCQFGRCLQTNAGNACVMQASTTCSSDTNCPDGSQCKAEACRSACTTDTQCLNDQSCINGACVGNDSTHDPGSGAAGGTGDAGAAGSTSTGGTSAGGTGGGPVSGGTGGTSGNGGAMPTGPDSGTGKINDPCTGEGDVTCAEHASTQRLICQGGVWTTAASCDAGKLCDSQSMPFGQCQNAVAECQGHNPGDSFCNAATRVQCGPDLITETQTKCDSVALCTGGNGAACAVCTAEQHQCTGKELQRCKDDGTGFVDEMACSDDTKPCNALAGACTAYACLKAGDLKCDADTLEQCNDALTGFTTVKNCGANLCNASACDVCIPNVAGCFNGSTTSSCSTDGQTLNKTACPAGTLHCIGNGQCVQCTAVADCPAPQACYTQSCDGTGTCAPSPVALNTPCGAGNTKYCSAAHACVECNSFAQCPAPGKCYSATCSANTCGTVALTPHTTCTGGGGVCDGSGTCVQCATNIECTGAASLCRGGSCVNPNELIGFSTGGSSTTLVTGNLYLVKLPLIPHNCVLNDLGIVATASATATVKLGLYGADGNGLPTGAVMDYTKAALTVAPGTLIQQPGIPGVALTAGQQYYIAVSTNTATTISVAASTVAGAGYRAADTYNSTASIWPAAPASLVASANQLAVFIDVTDTN